MMLMPQRDSRTAGIEHRHRYGPMPRTITWIVALSLVALVTLALPLSSRANCQAIEVQGFAPPHYECSAHLCLGAATASTASTAATAAARRDVAAPMLWAEVAGQARGGAVRVIRAGLHGAAPDEPTVASATGTPVGRLIASLTTSREVRIVEFSAPTDIDQAVRGGQPLLSRTSCLRRR